MTVQCARIYQYGRTVYIGLVATFSNAITAGGGILFGTISGVSLPATEYECSFISYNTSSVSAFVALRSSGYVAIFPYTSVSYINGSVTYIR
jgi:hypothetical protein